MSIDRRDFLRAGLAAVAASSLACDRSGEQQAKSKANGPLLSIVFKGQFLYITYNNQFQVCTLKPMEKGLGHASMIFLRRSALVGTPPPGDDIPAGDVKADVAQAWRGWPLTGNVSLRRVNGQPLPTPVTTSDATDGIWPEPVNDDEKWNSRPFIPQLGKIARGSKLKPTWRDECDAVFPLNSAKLRPRKPCKAAEAKAIWIWPRDGQQIPHVKAATDLVSYPSMAFPAGEELELTTGDIRIKFAMHDSETIAALCAPPRRLTATDPVYAEGDEIVHFRHVFRVLLDKDGNECPASGMYYLGQSTGEKVEGSPCLEPYSKRDDDIFCPGGEPDPGP
jgi:hypothetical protein